MRGIESADQALPAPFPAPVIPKKKYIVGIAPGPPFNIHDPDGTWTGISVELWREIANELGIDFEFRETNLNGNFDGLAQGWLDVAIGPLTITERREEICDFTHSLLFFNSGRGGRRQPLAKQLRISRSILRPRPLVGGSPDCRSAYLQSWPL